MYNLIPTIIPNFVVFFSISESMYSTHLQYTVNKSLVRKLPCLNVLYSAYSERDFKYGVDQFDLKQHSLIVSPNTVSSNLIIKLLLNCKSQVMRFSCLLKKRMSNICMERAKERP